MIKTVATYKHNINKIVNNNEKFLKNKKIKR